MSGAPPRILVIKHGALGDFVLAQGPFAAIRAHHPTAHIVLLTTPPFVEFGRASGCFDEVWTDHRPPWWRLDESLPLLRRLRRGRFLRVYDLQTSRRSSSYFRLLWPRRPEWSGIATGASHPHTGAERTRMHTVERQREQLRIAGIDRVPPPQVDFLTADIGRFELAKPFALLVPGGSAHRPTKRWPAAGWIDLGRALTACGVAPVLLGGKGEAALLQSIAAAIPGSRDLGGLTSFAEIAELARGAAVAVGNDTGPMHLIAAAGCPSLVLFSNASDPALCAPRGRVQVLRCEPLSALPATEVERAAAAMLAKAPEAP